MKEKILEYLKDEMNLLRTVDQIAASFNVDKGANNNELLKALNELELAGKIYRNKFNQYFLIEQLDMRLGTLSVHERGFGFVKIGEDEKDVFIDKSNIKDAFDKDVVLIKLTTPHGASRPEGVVVGVIERGRKKVVGLVKKNSHNHLYVECDDMRFKEKIYVDAAHAHGAMPGHKVVVEIKVYKLPLKGDVVKILGHATDPGIDILSIVYDHGVDIEFPNAVYDQIEHIPDVITKSEHEGRLDLTDMTIVTIDGDDAMDLDDAISLEKLPNGNYYLGVHIADVSHYVTEDSPLDVEAVERGTSIYLVDRVIPMLPHKLSNGICSLNPQVDRLTISCFMEIDHKGDVLRSEIHPTIIKSTHRMTYNNVNKILAGDTQLMSEYHDVLEMFYQMEDLAAIRRKFRDRRGSIDFDIDEGKVLVNETGFPVDVVVRARGISERIIEEFMLVANETIAQRFHWMEVPFIYRVHEHPDVKKLVKFFSIASAFGYRPHGSLDDMYPNQLAAIIEDSRGKDEHQVIATLMLRSMAKARYDQSCLGHFGLAADFYTHFTSPIRRYPDLLVHRLIRTYLFENRMDMKTIRHYESVIPDLALKASDNERLAIDIEREVEDMKKAEFMEAKVGQVFEGVISSVTNFGMFVELENTIEGLVHVVDMVDDYYFYDEVKLRYLGRHTGSVYGMGQKVKVKLKSASKAEKRIDFELVTKSNKKRRVNPSSQKQHKGKEEFGKKKPRPDNFKTRSRHKGKGAPAKGGSTKNVNRRRKSSGKKPDKA